ncbi:LysR family transcriptional regulator [Shewanella sp. WXL01]|uniref:LysR family transcriptional regulator n=1 Tax=Shewanella maritima TaxID=2520507 RepID=A0A411PEM8_9GAMM|nr:MULTISPECIES: LysR family transcriptional regulator [Shewanella]NKF49904.1 LysR family transcriptional regulator [Shewanella sp. WXL01]QBF82036.1 LysR family transcriptional regulator [Shewanella maritima]
MNKLEAMTAFCVVAEQQNFSAAARELGVSNTLVSRHVKQLEQTLGCLLLKRNTRKVYLTPAGEQYLEQIRPLLKKLNSVEAMMGQFSEQPSGKLTISTTFEMGGQYFAPLIAKYRKQYPKVELNIRLANSPADLFESDIDLAFRVAPNLPNASYIAQSIGQSRLSLWASPDYLAKFGEPTSPEGLIEHELLFFSHSIRKEQWIFEHNGERFTQKLPWTWSSDNGRLLNEAAASGQGIIQAPTYSVNEYVNQGRLVEVMPEYSINNLMVSAVFPHRLKLTNKISSFVAMAKAHFSEFPLP